MNKLSFCHKIKHRSVEKYPSSDGTPLFSVVEHFLFVEYHFSALQSTFFSWNTTFQRCRALYFSRTPLFSAAERFLFVEYYFSALQSAFFLWNTTFQRCRALYFRGTPLFSVEEHFIFVGQHFSALLSTLAK